MNDTAHEIAKREAEKERQKWEEIRAAERAAGGSQAESLAASSAWEQVSNAQATPAPPAPASPSPADVRDLVAGEFQKQVRVLSCWEVCEEAHTNHFSGTQPHKKPAAPRAPRIPRSTPRTTTRKNGRTSPPTSPRPTPP